MSSDKGYVAIYRDIFDHWLWSEKPFGKGQAWIDLIMMANHEDKTILVNSSEMVMKRGSFFTSEVKLAERWGWSRKKVRRFLSCLEAGQMLSRKGYSYGTALTIDNYSVYQGSRASKGTAKEQPGNSKGTAKEHKQERIRKDNQVRKRSGASAAAKTPALRPEDEHGEPLPDGWWDEE